VLKGPDANPLPPRLEDVIQWQGAFVFLGVCFVLPACLVTHALLGVVSFEAGCSWDRKT